MNTGSENIRILLVGGGTGGHFYPIVSIAEALNTTPERPRLYYAGPEPYDPDALARESITFVRIWAGKTRRYRSLLNFFDAFKTFFGLIGALMKLFVIYPDLVISKGGYTSVPVVLAAAFLRIPIIVHESDAVIGRANKLGSRFARHVVVSYEETESVLKGKSVLRFGIPIRKALLSPASPDAASSLNIDTTRPVILILGGSQGAERINALILDSLDELLSDFTVIHQTGKANFELCKMSAENLIKDEEQKERYRPTPFLDAETLRDVYHTANIVISRAGSTSIYEIALNGKPSILIPIPEGVSHDQRSNAYAYARSGAATVLEEKNLTDALLRAEIDRIMQDEKLYNGMRDAALAFGIPDSAAKIATLAVAVAKEH
jgi:UDP-N-acetylglucosamine--N-acetylmuramyl-(pentapeptide) pyrophosphoryl-undecaprenol N-acetylglucosamine transferase